MDTYQMVSELNGLYPEKTFINAHTPGCTVRAYYDALCRLTPLPPNAANGGSAAQLEFSAAPLNTRVVRKGKMRREW